MGYEQFLRGEETDEEAAAADARARADVAAGRVISNEAVKRWLRSWGSDNPLPPPSVGD